MAGFGFSQKLEMRHEFALRQRIILMVVTPDSACPNCEHEMTEEEVRTGWRNDPTDFTTECPKCNTRFEAQLLLTLSGESLGNHVYLCPIQLFHGLAQVQRGASKRLGIVFLAEKHPRLLWNMIRHFGTYEAGLREFRKQ